MQKLSQKALSIVSCPDPTQLTPGSEVQTLGLAPKAWSGQSDRRRAFIKIMRKRNKYFNRTAQSDIMIFIFHTDKFVILH